MTSVPHGLCDHAPCVSSRLIRTLVKKLENRGLQTKLETSYGDMTDDVKTEEIVVINPRSPERGLVRVGDDGFMTWEYSGKLDEARVGRILDEITNALQATGLPLRRPPS
jgi:hypothetical protein